MSETAALVPLHELVESCTPGEWGDDPINGNANCVVYRATDIDSEGKLNEVGGAARCVAPSKLLAKSLRPGDILLEASGGSPDQPVGRVALFAGAGQMPAVVSNFFRSMRPRSGVDSRFLVQQLVALNRGPAIWRYQQQTTGLTNLKVSDYLTHRLWVPDLPSQRRIAAILTSLDTAIEATEALIEKHQQIKAGLMHDLLTRGVADGGALRRSSLEAPDLYVPTKIGPVPVGWEVTGLQAKQRGADKWIRTGPFGSSLKGEHWVVEGCPVVTIGSLGEGVFDEHELLFVGERDAARLAEFRLKLGDVVFSRVADVGRSVVVRQENVGWIMSSNLMRIAVDTSQVRPDFLQMLLAGDARVKAQIRAKVNSGGREVANSEILGQLLFAWPPVDEQERIIERVQSIEAPIRLDQDRLRKLRMQKQGLMHDLLTGKVSVRAD